MLLILQMVYGSLTGMRESKSYYILSVCAPEPLTLLVSNSFLFSLDYSLLGVSSTALETYHVVDSGPMKIFSHPSRNVVTLHK